MNDQPVLGTATESNRALCSPVELAQAAATSMAEIAGNISGTIAGAIAAPLTAASHAAGLDRRGGDDDGSAAPHDETLAATARLETGEAATDGPAEGQEAARDEGADLG